MADEGIKAANTYDGWFSAASALEPTFDGALGLNLQHIFVQSKTYTARAKQGFPVMKILKPKLNIPLLRNSA